MEAAAGEWPPAAGKWPSNVEEILQEAKQAVSNVGVSMRVPEDLVNNKAEAQAEAYIPQMVSLGPYHHLWSKDKALEPSHQRPTHLSQMELYKLKKATEKTPELIKRLFTEISEALMISEFEQIYHLKIEEEDIPEFTWMMVVDALFLSNFLLVFTGQIIMPAKASIMCDIVKMENQIPLSLVIQVENASLIESQISILCRTCFKVGDPKIKIEKEFKHLLGYMHKCISSILQVENRPAEPDLSWRQRVSNVMESMVAALLGVFLPHPARTHHHDFLDKYNAKELRKAGIKFRSSEETGKIRFCKNSDTLYLPPIIISDPFTEVVLRNLLALEWNDAGAQKTVSQYVELMDCLIDTPQDVTLLRKCHVIVRQSMMITDDYVARTWDGMSKPSCLAGFQDVTGDLKAQIREALIKNYYKSKIRDWWDEFRTNYLSSPWKLMALVVGIFVLLLTMVQTYCSVKDCQPEHPTEDRSGRKRFGRFG